MAMRKLIPYTVALLAACCLLLQAPTVRAQAQRKGFHRVYGPHYARVSFQFPMGQLTQRTGFFLFRWAGLSVSKPKRTGCSVPKATLRTAAR